MDDNGLVLRALSQVPEVRLRLLELALTKEMLQARFGRGTLTVKLIPGTPPNFRQLIPQDTPLKVQVLARELEQAVRQVREMAKDASGIVRLVWSGTSMTVSAKSEEKDQVEATIPVETEGGDGRTALNVTYLLDYLKGKEGMVSMGVKDPQSPILFLHGGSSLVLAMPMLVQE